MRVTEKAKQQEVTGAGRCRNGRHAAAWRTARGSPQEEEFSLGPLMRFRVNPRVRVGVVVLLGWWMVLESGWWMVDGT